MKWPSVALGDYIDILPGFAFKSESFNTEERGLPLVRIRDVLSGRSDTFYDGEFNEEFVVSDGDLLVGMDGEFYRARWCGGQSLLNQRVCRIRPKNKLILEQFLYWVLPQVLKRIEDRTPFVTVKHLSAKVLERETIPLPPLDEQRRIAAILDKADELRAKRRAALAKLDTLTQSIFIDMFVDSSNVAMPASTKTINEICDLVRGSSPRPQGDPRFFGGPVPRLMIADITRDGTFVTPSIDSLTAEGASQSRLMPAGSVVMAVSGAVGLAGILTIEACVHDGFVGFRNLDPSIRPLYFYYYLVNGRKHSKQLAPGAIWSNLTTDQVKRFVVPIPSIEMQMLFEKRLTLFQGVKKKFVEHQASSEMLFTSLQHRAFRGEL